MPRNYIHVVPRPSGGWAARREGVQRASAVAPTQEAVIGVARNITRQEKGELVVHGRDGRIRQKDSHGRDPYPPKG